VRIERRVVGTQTHLMPAMATELVALAPDVLVSIGTVNTAALAERTAKTPIVFVNVSDPVQSGFTDGLSKPSRNITGFVVFDPLMGGKMLQLLKDLTPEIRRVTAISNADTAPGNRRPSMEDKWVLSIDGRRCAPSLILRRRSHH